MIEQRKALDSIMRVQKVFTIAGSHTIYLTFS